MAHHKSALKRIEISERLRVRNRQYKTRMRSAIKNVLEAENKEAATEAVVKAYAIIDKLTVKKIIPKNNAAHKKSRLARHVNAMS